MKITKKLVASELSALDEYFESLDIPSFLLANWLNVIEQNLSECLSAEKEILITGVECFELSNKGFFVAHTVSEQAKGVKMFYQSANGYKAEVSMEVLGIVTSLLAFNYLSHFFGTSKQLEIVGDENAKELARKFHGHYLELMEYVHSLDDETMALIYRIND